MVRDIAHGLAHPRHRAEVVVCLHQVAEADLVLRRNDVDGHLGKNHHGFPEPHDCLAALISGHGEEVHYLRQLPGRAGERSKYKSALPGPQAGPTTATCCTVYNDLDQGAGDADYFYNELGCRTLATVHDGSPYAEQLVRVAERAFEKLGGEVVAAEAVTPTDVDMRPIADRCRNRQSLRCVLSDLCRRVGPDHPSV